MGTIKIGSSANRKGITVEPSTVLFDGNHVKKIMKGLVTIWKEIKPLIPTMTSNTTPSGEVTYSGTVITGNPYNAFDNADSTVFELSGSTTNWVQYKFNTAVNISSVGIDAVDRRSSNHISLGVRVKNLTLQASNNGTSWTDLISVTTVNDTSIPIQMFDVDTNEAYQYYRFKVSGSHNTGNTGNVINQLQLY